MTISSPPRPVAVLDSAITWTHVCLQLARSSPLDVPTPCADWDLGRLLQHMEDSLTALGEAAEHGRLLGRGVPAGGRPSVDRIMQLGCDTRAAWQARVTSSPINISDLSLGRDTTVLVGALEIAVHGWDVAQATGQDRRMPEDLAVRLYTVAVAVVTPGERGTRFGPALEVPADASMSTRLLAHLGRRAG